MEKRYGFLMRKRDLRSWGSCWRSCRHRLGFRQSSFLKCPVTITVLAAYLERSGRTYFNVNPLQAKQTKDTQLRKVKTDPSDAWHLAEMYYRGDVTSHRSWEEGYNKLQHETRQHEFVTGMFVQAKLNMRALLDQVFPE
ncbi:Transposase [compost metagenome]